MQPAKWVQNIGCGGDGCFIYPHSFLLILAINLSSPLVCARQPLVLVLGLPRACWYPLGPRVDSKGEMVWSVREWFLVKRGSRKFPLVHIFAWNAWTNGKLSSPYVHETSSQFFLNCHFQLKLSQYTEQPTYSFDFPRSLSFIAKSKCSFWVIIV